MRKRYELPEDFGGLGGEAVKAELVHREPCLYEYRVTENVRIVSTLPLKEARPSEPKPGTYRIGRARVIHADYRDHWWLAGNSGGSRTWHQLLDFLAGGGFEFEPIVKLVPEITETLS